MSTKREEYRRNAAERAAVGSGVFGAGAYGNYRVERALKQSGKPGLWDATKARKLSSTHLKYGAGKLGARSLQVTGLPLAAVGVSQMIKPKKNRPVDLHSDVVRPVVGAAALQDQVKRGERRISKQDNDVANRENVYRSKQRARHFSQVSGSLGLAALGLRAPEAASAITRQAVKRGKKVSPRLTKLAAKEPAYTKASNTLGIGAIGVGSAGSFNFARLQGLEAKREKVDKAIPKVSLKDLKRAKNLKNAYVDRVTLKRKATAEQFLPEGKLIGERPKGVDDSGVPYTDLDKPYQISYVSPMDEASLSGKIGEKFGIRRFDFGVKGEGKSQIRGAARVLPTGRIIPEGFTANRGASRATAATIKEITANAHRAKSPGITFRAAGYDKKSNPGVGYTAWRGIEGVGFTPGLGYGRAGIAAFYPRKSMNRYFLEGEKQMNKKDVRAMRAHILRAYAGKGKPSDANAGRMARGEPAHDYMKNMSWWGTIPGRTPFLGKTKVAAGAGAGALGWEEVKHPRGQGGKFRTKGTSIQKRDDRFLREYKDRISPKAELSYNRMKATRNKRAVLAGSEGALGGGLIAYGAKEFTRGHKGSAALSVLGGSLSLNNAADHLATTKGYNRAIGGIKNKAKERATLNQYGQGRVPKQQVDFAKALIRVRAPRWGMARPKGILRKPAIRDGHLMRTASGKTVSVRGSIG